MSNLQFISECACVLRQIYPEQQVHTFSGCAEIQLIPTIKKLNFAV